jgi:1,4-alpha-glucan branching enzyme
MWGWPGKKLLFMGCEFGQSREWNYASSLDWHLLQYKDHEGIRLLVRDLNKLYRDEPVLGCNDLNHQGFRWLCAHDSEGGVLAYLRCDATEESLFAVVGHFTPVAREQYRIGVPRLGFWREVINTNSHFYGGNGLGNDGGRMAIDAPCDGQPHSLLLTLPPSSTTILKWSAREPSQR